jgi:hypothetical protein
MTNPPGGFFDASDNVPAGTPNPDVGSALRAEGWQPGDTLRVEAKMAAVTPIDSRLAGQWIPEEAAKVSQYPPVLSGKLSEVASYRSADVPPHLLQAMLDTKSSPLATALQPLHGGVAKLEADTAKRAAMLKSATKPA